MRLTFEGGKFVLHKDGKKTETTDIKAAARFRPYAAGKAKTIFDRLMLKAYGAPTGRPQLSMPLYPYQENEGVPFILKQNRTYLAHSPGLGKTAQCLGAVSMKPGRTLIICPSFLKINWAREITKWWNQIPSITMVRDSNKIEMVDWSADFIIVSDSMLLKDWVREALNKIRFRFVFIDEGHRFKTPNAARTVALFGGKTKKIKSSGLIYGAEHVSILSGTPMLNRPIELWPILYAMAPETIDFMSYESFGFKYCGPTRNEYGFQFLGSHNEAELKDKIVGPFMHRLKKEDVLKDLPPKVREVIYAEDNRYKEERALDGELLKDLKRRDFEPPKTLGDYAKMRHLNGLAKIKFAAGFVKEILESDLSESILLFAYHRDVVAGLFEELKNFEPMVIMGGVQNEDRTEIEDLFQSGKGRLIIGNIHAMNLGLTLTRATRVVFAEYDWTPSNNEQAEDRANRIGSKWSVFCQYIVFANSIDEMILRSTLLKEERIRKVVG